MKFVEKTLWQNIQSENYLPVYLVTGTDGYLKQQYVSLFADRVVPAGLEAFNLHKFEGDVTEVDEIATCVEALPAMCEKTCVIVHDLPFSGLTEDEQEKMLTMLRDLPDTCVLVFWQDTENISQRTTFGKDVVNLIDKAGAVCTIDKRTQKDLTAFVVKECKKNEREIDYDTALYFVQAVGDDMSNLINEIEKVCFYTNSAITVKDIDAVAIKSLEATTFKMLDYLVDNDFENAYKMLGVLFDQKTDPILIVGAIVSSYVDMYRAKIAVESGHSIKDVKAAYPSVYKSDFRLKSALNRSKKYTVKGLREALEIISRADIQNKSTFAGERLTIEKLFIDLSMARRIK
ncbi:MAG: DNA polymerase III subunit delta [Oscillospiraceae bacterium]|nr:DNA polymerase III subunit delta [Oscillospiraceae bacterium]